MTKEEGEVVLSEQDLRDVTGYAAECAQEVLEIFENMRSADSRPREAIEAAWAFARGGKRGKPLRDTGWAAQKAARGPRHRVTEAGLENCFVIWMRPFVADSERFPGDDTTPETSGASHGAVISHVPPPVSRPWRACMGDG